MKKGSNLRLKRTFLSKSESHLSHTIVWQMFLALVRKAAENGRREIDP